MATFQRPDFRTADIELRLDENDVICIYGTDKGLKLLSDYCLQLIKNHTEDHIHLEDCISLTKSSKMGAIALFHK